MSKTPRLAVRAAIKEVATGYNIGGDFAEKLDEKVKQLIHEATRRADQNGRKTVMAKDL
jgi:histone H3/H4